MNENINLTKILKGCPKGFGLYSPLFGDVKLNSICDCHIDVVDNTGTGAYFNKLGQYISTYEVLNECVLFPSKDQRDWSKFTAPWYKKERFDPKTLKALDKILLRDECGRWHCGSFSHINKDGNYKFGCFELKYKYYIPYNDETRYLIGTTEEAPEFYRYWEK